MKTKVSVLCLLMFFFVLIPSTVTATKPGEAVNPNGFPSGAHFNLNFIGKQADFDCPSQEYLKDELGNLILDGQGNPIPVYGNVIFIPEYSAQAFGPKIIIESGQKGPKSAPATAALEVTDWCSGFALNDSAKFRLPANESGYNVYARILAKPTDNPSITFSDPGLVYAIDEFGNDLVWLGLVTSSGFQTPTYTFTRSKGKSTATDITGLFTWSGYIFYITEPSGESTPTLFCARDTNADGIFDEYYQKGDALSCAEGYTEVTLYGVQHTDEWVFNIADFVEMFYQIDNSGSKLIQVRFYPRQ